MLTIGGMCRWPALLGLVTGVLAFIPNIGAITSGVLMVAVGFSASASQGSMRIFVYFLVHNIDGYLVVPYIARRTVDLAPAVLLAMQLLMGALFGILGVLFADPILATLKVVLVDLSHQHARRKAKGRRSSPASWPIAARAALLLLLLLLHHLLLHHRRAAAARPCARGRRRSARCPWASPAAAAVARTPASAAW